MEKRSEKLRAANAVANILNRYRNHVCDTEQEIEDNGESVVGYPYYDREKLKKEWKFWTGKIPNKNDPTEIRVFDKLYNLILVLNDLEEYH